MQPLTLTRRSWVSATLLLAAVGLFYLWFQAGTANYTNLPPSADGPWVAFGDSLTEGYGASEGQSYPAVLSRALGFPIVNAGRSGDTTMTALDRLEDVLRTHPRVALICLGGNDALNGESRSRMISNLGAIIDRFQQEGSFVVLIGIRSASLRDKQEKDFRELARRKRVLYVPDMLRGIAFKPVYMSDAIHPNDAGYQYIAQRIEKALQPVVSQIKPSEVSGVGR